MLKFLRQYKLAYQLFNFFQKSHLEYNEALYKKYGINKKYYSSVQSADFEGIDFEKNFLDTHDSAVELPKNEIFKALDVKTQSELLSWSTNGYVILEKFFSDTEIDSFNHEIDTLVKNKEVSFGYQNKIMFAIHKSKKLLDAGTNTKLLSILNMLMGKKVDLFQSINFLHGSQQRTHSDSVHMTTFPTGNIIAIWVALEDIYLENGPLHYYPGSHKLPYIFNKDYDNLGTKFKLGEKTYPDYENKIDEVVKGNKLEKQVFLAKKGDLLIWHANLLHGGEPHLDKNATRKSMVFHYYAQDAICFHEITQRPTLKKLK